MVCANEVEPVIVSGKVIVGRYLKHVKLVCYWFALLLTFAVIIPAGFIKIIIAELAREVWDMVRLCL